MFPLLFETFSNSYYFRVDFMVFNSMGSGMASLVLKRNLLPSNGICFVDKYTGLSLNTWFNITCTGWIDQDGAIATYEFLSKIFKYWVDKKVMRNVFKFFLLML
jgi:hypothetical protein